MDQFLDFIMNNWEGPTGIAAFLLWIVVRVVPTQKNYDLIEMVVKLVGQIIKNRRKDSLGNVKENK